jgi:hypothetical protein
MNFQKSCWITRRPGHELEEAREVESEPRVTRSCEIPQNVSPDPYQ